MALYLITTPIGNLGDITQRAQETLGQVDLILAEDTRQTAKLLKHLKIDDYEITTYNDQNKHRKIPQIITQLQQGKEVGLVSNAGSPVISDPGYELVKMAIKQKVEIISIPGPTALTTALVVSGFPPTRFTFLGFLPKSKTKKTAIFKSLSQTKENIPTVIFYESPKRLIATLEVAHQVFGNLPTVICRELTKKFEEKIRGKLVEVIDKLKQRDGIKGEITALIKLE